MFALVSKNLYHLMTESTLFVSLMFLYVGGNLGERLLSCCDKEACVPVSVWRGGLT